MLAKLDAPCNDFEWALDVGNECDSEVDFVPFVCDVEEDDDVVKLLTAACPGELERSSLTRDVRCCEGLE